ncbi:MAG: hypothetical protein P1U90_09565 [Akkermansiaceae bacterium]|nr:hypothetical protein [Akkermansiaceae bacterium]
MKLAATLVLALASFAPSKDLTKLPGSHRTATLPSGTYFLTQPFELKNLSSFTLRAEPDAKVVISGNGTRLSHLIEDFERWFVATKMLEI